MGKRYYCDYCERSFADGADNRKKHLASLSHIKLRKTHYEMFKDAATILQENRSKNPCRKFHQTGVCEFGNSCKYSHLTASDVKQLEELASSEQKSSENRVEPDIDSWLQTKVSKLQKSSSSVSNLSEPVLPPVLENIPNLPPSLKPPTSADFLKIPKKQMLEWG